MKKIFIFLFSFSIFANEKAEKKLKDLELTPYLDISIGPCPLPSPGFGIGIRQPGNRLGFDASVNADILFLRGDVSILINVKPRERSSRYVGLGLTGYRDWYDHQKSIMPQISFGKNKLNSHDQLRFYEFELTLIGGGYYVPIIPVATVKWGFGF